MINLFIEGKLFKDRSILNNVSINFSKGMFVVITGVSGVGKSSLLNIIGLLDSDFVGTYKFQGESVNFKTNMPYLIRKRYFGYVFQDSLINERQSVERNLLCAIDYKEHKAQSGNISEVLRLVGLKQGMASSLSGGEKQRLALARAMMKKPIILLADEPTASLDKNNKRNVMHILEEYHNNGGTVVMVTHDIDIIKNNMRVYELSDN